MASPGRTPIPEDERQPLPPKLGIYWESAELRDAVEDFIVQEQAAGRLPKRIPRGQKYGISHFVMAAIKEKLERDRRIHRKT